MNQQKIPDDIMDKIIEKFNSTDYSQSYQHRIVAAEFGYSIAAEELARCREALDGLMKEVKFVYEQLPTGHWNLDAAIERAEALSSLPGKQEGEMGK